MRHVLWPLLAGCTVNEPVTTWYLDFEPAEMFDDGSDDPRWFVYSDGTVAYADRRVGADGEVVFDSNVNATARGHLVRFDTDAWWYSTDRGDTWEDVRPDRADEGWSAQIEPTGRLVAWRSTDGGTEFGLSDRDGRGWAFGTVSHPEGAGFYAVVDDRAMFSDPDNTGDPETVLAATLPGGGTKRLVSTKDFRTAAPTFGTAGGVPAYASHHVFALEANPRNWLLDDVLPITLAPKWEPSHSAWDLVMVRGPGTRDAEVLGVDEEDRLWVRSGGATLRATTGFQRNRDVRDDYYAGPRCEQRIWPEVDPEEPEDASPTPVRIVNDSDQSVIVIGNSNGWQALLAEPVPPGATASFDSRVGTILGVEAVDGRCYGFWRIQEPEPTITVVAP